eukprot:Nitzschia sp. Nitz4//scaffold1_size375055//323192//324516//NITZ4_000331-RA/size375055-processed-gene-0.170-mRNA-1//-1//CDS//3329541210//5282//frame0
MLDYSLRRIPEEPSYEEGSQYSYTHPGMSRNVMDEESVEDLTLLDEIKFREASMRAMRLEALNGSKQTSGRRYRRKRGNSLEQEICDFIMQTVTDSARNPTTMVQESREDSMTSAEYILRDLDQPLDVTSLAESKSIQVMPQDTCDDEIQSPDNYLEADEEYYDDPDLVVTFPDSDDDEDEDEDEDEEEEEENQIPPTSSSIVSQCQAESPAPPVVQAVEDVYAELLGPEDEFPPKVEFGKADSFESLSWEEGTAVVSRQGPYTNGSVSTSNSRKQTDSVSVEQMQRNPQEQRMSPSVQGQRDVPQGQPRREEECIFKTNFDEWSTFETSPFRFDDEEEEPIDVVVRGMELDENGFVVSRPSRTIPKLKPPRQSFRAPYAGHLCIVLIKTYQIVYPSCDVLFLINQ